MELLRIEEFVSGAFYAMLGFHLWVKRGDIAALVAATVELASSMATTKKPTTMPREDSDENKWVRARMDEMRVRNLLLCMKLVSAGCIVRTVVLSIARDKVVIEFGLHGYVVMMFVQTFAYAVSFCLSSGLVQLTLCRARTFYVAGVALQMLWLWVANVGPFFCDVKAVRVVPNTIVALAVLDKRFSWPANILWFLVLTYKQKQQSVPGALEMRSVSVITDLVIALAVMGLSWIAEAAAESYIRLNYGAVTTASVRDAMLRLLSVLCDGALQLTPQLAIVKPSQRAADLLAPGEGAAGAARVQGQPIADFVAENDRERLMAFLTAGADSEGSTASGGGAALPRSLQVQLVDSAGRSFPAELFHATMPRAEGGGLQPGHLLGVRECDPGRREASTAAEPRGPTLRPLFRSRTRAPSSASSSTAPSAPAAHYEQVRQDLPELQQIEMRFDPLDPTLAIREAKFVFCGPGTGNPAQLPHLMNFIPDGMQFRTWQWIQDRVNDEVNDNHRALPIPILPLVWPGRSSEPVILESSQVELSFEDAESDSSDEEQEEEEEAALQNEDGGRVDAVLQLGGFTQITMVRHRRHHHQHEGHRTSEGGRATRSGRSRRSHVRSDVGLPSVVEGDVL